VYWAIYEEFDSKTFGYCCCHFPQEGLFGTPWMGMVEAQRYKGSCNHHKQVVCNPTQSLYKASLNAP